jgi:hypothetical protein
MTTTGFRKIGLRSALPYEGKSSGEDFHGIDHRHRGFHLQVQRMRKHSFREERAVAAAVPAVRRADDQN